MATTDINDDTVEVIYTDDTQLAVYPDWDLEPGGFVEQEQARYDGQPVPNDIVKRYFWWYRFLLLNKDYADCCKAKGKGHRYAAFYVDWNDIFALPFPRWWQQHGREIAGLDKWLVKDMSNEDDLESYRRDPSHLLVAVDLDASANRKAIYEAVTTLIKAKLDERANATHPSGVYVADPCDYESLKWAYEVYVGYNAKVLDTLNDKKPNRAEVARTVGLPSTHMRDDEVEDDRQKARKERNAEQMASQIIKNALEKGRFPVHDRRQAAHGEPPAQHLS